MSALTAAARGRAAAIALMTDACVITRITGRVLNPTTGALVDTTTTVYTGKCRFKAQQSARPRDLAAGETAVPENAPVVSVPITVTAVNEGDRVSITASNDPGAVGKTLLVRTVLAGTHITARRLLCGEL